jgi:hypothetical protein
VVRFSHFFVVMVYRHPRGSMASSIFSIRPFSCSIEGFLNHSKKKSYSPSLSPDLLMIVPHRLCSIDIGIDWKYSAINPRSLISGTPLIIESIIQTSGMLTAIFSSSLIALTIGGPYILTKLVVGITHTTPSP